MGPSTGDIKEHSTRLEVYNCGNYPQRGVWQGKRSRAWALKGPVNIETLFDASTKNSLIPDMIKLPGSS